MKMAMAMTLICEILPSAAAPPAYNSQRAAAITKIGCGRALSSLFFQRDRLHPPSYLSPVSAVEWAISALVAQLVARVGEVYWR